MSAAGASSAERGGAVSTAFPRATEAGVRVLEEGGNAVDAAVAAAWALSVCEPSASGIGGQTTLLFSGKDGTTVVVDGHSHAPRLASEDTISHAEQQRGRKSCTIPSTPVTLEHVHRRYGRLGWAQVLAPARAIAEEGFAVTPLLHKQIGWVKKSLREDAAASESFLRDGEPAAVGQILRQPRLAETLGRLAENGAVDFYRGALARDIADDMRNGGGLVDEEDLATFAGPVERGAISIRYRGLDVVTVPPPGGGLQILVALKLLEELLPDTLGASGDDWYVAIALAIYGAFLARESFPVSPDGSDPAFLFGADRIARLADRLRHGPLPGGEAGEEAGDTTHLTVADGEGNVVALTQSIQSVFGAKVANGKLGFLYNNYLRTCPRRPHPSRLGPRCPSRSNVSPVIVRRRGTPILALGSAGSRRITSSVLQVLSNVVDRGMDLPSAVAAPRVHALLSGKVWLESRIPGPTLAQRLAQRFSTPVCKVPFSFSMGAVHALGFSPGATFAAADPRRDGTCAVLPPAPAPAEDRR